MFRLNYATKDKLLKELKESTKTLEVTQELQEAFDCLKDELTYEPALNLPDEEDVVYSEHEWNRRKVMPPICYVNKVLNEAEQRCYAPEAEMFAVVFFEKQYPPVLTGRKFVVQFGNHALSWLKSYAITPGIVGRWATLYFQYAVKIQRCGSFGQQNVEVFNKKTAFSDAREGRLEKRLKCGPVFRS